MFHQEGRRPDARRGSPSRGRPTIRVPDLAGLNANITSTEARALQVLGRSLRDQAQRWLHLQARRAEGAFEGRVLSWHQPDDCGGDGS